MTLIICQSQDHRKWISAFSFLSVFILSSWMSYLNKFSFITAKVHSLSKNRRCSDHSDFAWFLGRLIIGVLYPEFIISRFWISYYVHQFVQHHGTVLPNDDYARNTIIYIFTIIYCVISTIIIYFPMIALPEIQGNKKNL